MSAAPQLSVSRLLAREPALIMWAIFLLSTPFYVLNAGMPQPGNLFVFFLIPKANRWRRGWDPSLSYILKPLVKFTVWATIVNYGWAIVNWKLDYKEYGLFPIFYIYDLCVLYVALAAYNRFRNQFLWLTLYCVFIAVVAQVVLSFVYPSGRVRGSLFFKSPNELGYYALLAGCLLAISRKRLEFGMSKVGAALIGCAYLASISASRASLGGIALLFLLLVFSSPRMVIVGSLVAIALLVVGGPVFQAIENSQQRFLVAQHAETTFSDERGYSRLWKHAEFLPLGAGEGDWTRFDEPGHKAIEIHSGAATILFSYGVLGLFWFMQFIVRVLRGASSRAIWMMVPVLMYTVAHQALRFTTLWVVIALFIAIKTPTGPPLPRRLPPRKPARVPLDANADALAT
jgi:hypothetical protein